MLDDFCHGTRLIMQVPTLGDSYGSLMNTQRLLISTQFLLWQKRNRKSRQVWHPNLPKSNCIGQIIIIKTTTKQTKIIGKYSKTHYFNRIETFMTNWSITGECTTSMAQFGKGFCLSMVHSGVNKMLSNDPIIENYQTAIAG